MPTLKITQEILDQSDDSHTHNPVCLGISQATGGQTVIYNPCQAKFHLTRDYQFICSTPTIEGWLDMWRMGVATTPTELPFPVVLKTPEEWVEHFSKLQKFQRDQKKKLDIDEPDELV